MGNVTLLLISYGLYISWKPVYALILLWVTVVTFFTARLQNSDKESNKEIQNKILLEIGRAHV